MIHGLGYRLTFCLVCMLYAHLQQCAMRVKQICLSTMYTQIRETEFQLNIKSEKCNELLIYLAIIRNGNKILPDGRQTLNQQGKLIPGTSYRKIQLLIIYILCICIISVRLFQIRLSDKFDSNFLTGAEDSLGKEPVSSLTDYLTGSYILFLNLFTLTSSSFHGL